MTRRLRVLVGIGIAVTGLGLAAIMASRTIAQIPPGSVTYRYDSLGRVAQDTYPAKAAAYDYDAAGNWVAFTLK